MTRVWRGEEKQRSRPHIRIDAPQAFIMLHLSLLTAMLKIQSLWRHDIWETAQANKGHDKGKMWAMVMQLNAEPTHEYGSCGADSSDALSWRVRSMHCMRLLVWPHNLTHKLCMSLHFCILIDMLHVLRDQTPPHWRVCICPWTTLSWTRKKSINQSVRGKGPSLCPGINAAHPRD